MLSTVGLTCIKRDRVLFENLNFHVSAGEIVHLKGENGAGKTSLIRILAGLSSATDGEMFFKQENIEGVWDSYTSQLLYVGHKAAINASLNAIENSLFWAAQQGISTELETVESILLKLGLAGIDDIPVTQLSAGQQRRVALARLWLKPQAKLWLLDEPFTALDVDGVALVESHLHEHVKNGGAALITSHQALSDTPLLREWQLEYRF